MRIFQNTADRQALDAAEEQNFIDDCKGEFIEKSLAVTNARKVKTLTLASFLPNLLSAATAGFFVLFLLSGYTRTAAIILGVLLLTIVLAVEIGKRLLIADSAHTKLTAGKLPFASLAALVILVGVSMGASYQGGSALAVETAAPPPRPNNPQIDSLTTLLHAELSTIDRLQKTTWKGKVTSDAVKGINQAKRVQTTFVERIAYLHSLDDAAHVEAVEKHTAKHVNFGIILGLLAALADVFLLGMLWTAQRLKFEVAAVHARQSAAKAKAAQEAKRAALEAEKAAQIKTFEAALKAAQDAAKAAQEAAEAAQAKQGNIYGNMPPHVLNQAEPQRRGIGFTVERNDKSYNDKSYNDKSYNETAPEREVVTVTEREVVELTDRVKTCAHCGQRFRYFNSKAKYCSDACRITAWEQRTGRAWKGGRGA